ncbi:metallophosphoesterase [Paenibacillus sp. J2TS4]|uniref:metallophosphoesterase n=1 Tax=Paenibacillus sp. J2TS4 TaxID=2807194 RepID=UPI001B0FE91B|nr:metallophosphoesterase [Paenibacillus sp. J2TS4]GIP33935.1 phosphoesterase [Paenibacillus sp. J2TS4]
MSLGIAIAMTIAVIIIILYVYNTWWIEISPYEIRSDLVKRPVLFVHLSDLHGMTAGINGRISRLVTQIDPDFVVVTGDLATRTQQLPRVMDEISRIPHRNGIYFVPGNYEREESIGWRKRPIAESDYLSRIGQHITVLDNRAAEIQCNGNSIHLYGFDNSIYGNERLPDSPCANSKESSLEIPYSIGLAHCPSIIKYLEEHRIDFHLLLAGHTHGGQIRLFGKTWGSYRHYPIGLSRLSANRYFGIHRGLGTVKLPIRLNCRPEIVVYRLVPA